MTTKNEVRRWTVTAWWLLFTFETYPLGWWWLFKICTLQRAHLTLGEFIHTQVLLGISHLYGDTLFRVVVGEKESVFLPISASNPVYHALWFHFHHLPCFSLHLIIKQGSSNWDRGFQVALRGVRSHDQGCHGSSGWKVLITTCSQQRALGSTEAPISRIWSLDEMDS